MVVSYRTYLQAATILLICQLFIRSQALNSSVVSYRPFDKSCAKDKALDKLVMNNRTRTIMYLLSHDDHSEQIARKFAQCKEHWVRVVRLNVSIFFETVIYKDVYPLYMEDWRSVDYIVSATYKTIHTIQLHKGIYYKQDEAEVRKMLEVASAGGYDFVPFLRSHTTLMDSILYWHGPAFKVAWDALLSKLGFSIERIRQFDSARPFYRNIFISRPRTLLKLCDLMSQAMAIVKEDKDLAALFETDAKYAGGKEEVALKVFGTKYYQLHPFIFERLPSFFLHEIGANVCMSKSGPCAYNY